MDGGARDHPNGEIAVEAGKDRSPEACSSSSASSSAPAPATISGAGAGAGCYRLFNRQRSVHQIVGGGKAADIILWKCGRVTVAVIISATVAWLLFEKSDLSFLTTCCDVLLILIVVQFIRVKTAALLHKQPRPLPELVLSEEMVNNVAASFRVKVNNMLMMAHDITLGKDFRLFFQVVVFLWLLSVIGNLFSSFTLAYIGTIALVTIPALYNKYEERVDRYAGMVHQKISKHYKVVDENVISRLPRRFIKDKAACFRSADVPCFLSTYLMCYSRFYTSVSPCGRGRCNQDSSVDCFVVDLIRVLKFLHGVN